MMNIQHFKKYVLGLSLGIGLIVPGLTAQAQDWRNHQSQRNDRRPERQIQPLVQPQTQSQLQIPQRQVRPEFQRDRQQDRHRETDSRIGMKPGGEMRSATTISGVTTNKGAPGNWSASASGNAPCWNASAGYTVPTRTPIEITTTTAITITGMVTTATA